MPPGARRLRAPISKTTLAEYGQGTHGESSTEERKQKAEGKQLADFLELKEGYLRYSRSLQKRHTIGGPELSDYAKSVCDLSEQTLSRK